MRIHQTLDELRTLLGSMRARAIDRSDHLIEEIKTDDKAAMQRARAIIEEWKREKERERNIALRSGVRSNDAPELISPLVPLSSFGQLCRLHYR